MVAHLVALALVSASGENPYLAQAIDQIRQLDEAAALDTLEKARALAKDDPDELARVQLYVGLAHAGLSHEAEAVDAFKSALVLDPKLVLPKGQSPRVRDWWVRAGGSLVAEAPPLLTPKPVEPAAPVVVSAPPPLPKPHLRRWVGAAGMVAGAVLLGFAVRSGAQASSQLQTAQADGNAVSAQQEEKQAHASAFTANLLYGAGGVLAIGGGVAFVTDF